MRVALATNCSRVFCMHRRVARAVSVAHEFPEVKPVIVSYLTPALRGSAQRDNVIETPATGVREQMRFLQAAPAQPSRCSFRLQCRDGNPSRRRDSVDVGCARRNCTEQQSECR